MKNSALIVSRSGKQIECNSLQCPLKFLIKETQRRAAADECTPPINSTQNVITWLSMTVWTVLDCFIYPLLQYIQIPKPNRGMPNFPEALG